MEIIKWNDCSIEQQKSLLMRPAMEDSKAITESVANIIKAVRLNGDSALQAFTRQFDGVEASIKVDSEIINSAGDDIPKPLKEAINQAMNNIERFHLAQKTESLKVVTMPGIVCQQLVRPIQAVGLYIPGGTAPLLSTVMMLAIPARIAGCSKIVLASPPPIAREILYIAKLCGIDQVYNVGGAQAIAAMAFGTETIPKVDKIFGPGNSYVTEAKRQVSQIIGGAAIDMPAGPSEVLVIADRGANPVFIAADLLSQAEHGADSQVVFVTSDEKLAENVALEIDQQLKDLPRKDIASKALSKSRLIVVDSIDACIEISNDYGPEHLIIQTRSLEKMLDQITNAGSVFLGDWSPESVGDYASGTNHVLPTYGYTSTYSSLGLPDFQKRMTAQQLSPEGLLNISETVELLASAELLMAHKNAVTVRVNALKALKVPKGEN